jgi:hypothetical protein
MVLLRLGGWGQPRARVVACLGSGTNHANCGGIGGCGVRAGGGGGVGAGMQCVVLGREAGEKSKA